MIVAVLVVLVALPAATHQTLAQTGAPAKPTGLLVSSFSHDWVALAWDAPGDASITSYQVLRRSRDGPVYKDGKGPAGFVVIADDTGSPATTYTDTSVAPGTRYVYRVKAKNAQGLGPQSSYLNAETQPSPRTIPTPSGLTAPSASHDSVTLNWDDPADTSIIGYQVLRRRRDGWNYGDGRGPHHFAVIADHTGSPATTYTDTSVAAETRYSYRVKARGLNDLSAPSSHANAQTPPAPSPPAGPTGLTVAARSRHTVTLTWDDPGDVSITGYQVIRRPRDGPEFGDRLGSRAFVVIADDTGSPATTFTDTSLTPRTRYNYRILARNHIGLSEASTFIGVTTLAVPPPAGLLVSSASHDVVMLAWDDPGDPTIDGYQVLRRPRDAAEYEDGLGAAEFVAIVEDTGTPATTYADRSVTARTRYVYQLRAWSGDALSKVSASADAETPAVVLTPRAPTGLVAVSARDSVTLTWDDPEDDSIESYQVLRRSRDGPEYEDSLGAPEFAVVVEDTGSSATSHIDTSVTPRTRYVYRLQARNSHGLSPTSSYASAETLDTPIPPTGLTAPSIAHDSVTLAWDDTGAYGISGYRILRRDAVNQLPGDFSTIKEDTGSPATTYTDSTVEPETRYVYRVQAINPVGVSARSSYVNAETPAAPDEPLLPPPAPVAGAFWSATMQVGEGTSGGHTYFGYSSFVITGLLGWTEFEHESRENAVLALAFSETARDLRLVTRRPLDSGLVLRVSGHDFRLVHATARAIWRGGGMTAYSWETSGLGWAVEDEVAVYLKPDRARPNVVLILADDLGWGDIRSNNPDSGMHTPRIDSIAASGMRFSDAHSPSSVCSPTRYGLLTGRYAWRTWLQEGVLGGTSGPLIEASTPTLGTLLQGHGYRTAAIGKWHLGMNVPRLAEGTFTRTTDNPGVDLDREVSGGPTARGFDEFFGLSANVLWAPFVYIRDERFTTVPESRQVLDRLTEEAVAFIDRAEEEDAPFFLYLPLTAPHRPFVAAWRFLGTTGMGLYGDFVAQIDWTVDQVLAALERTGARDNTLVIFTSDNGAMIGRLPNHAEADHTEDPSVRKYRVGTHQSNADWRGGKRHIYEGGHRIPLLMQWPGVIEAGSTSATTVSLTDLYATLADIVGDELESGVAPDSVSLLPLLRGEAMTRGVPVVHHSNGGMFALRDERWKLVFGDGAGDLWGSARREPFSKPWQLYDLDADPGETTNLVEDHPDIVARLEAALDAIRAADPDTRSDDATLSNLTVGGAAIGLRAGATTDFAVTAGSAAEVVEVRATPTDEDAHVTIADADGYSPGLRRSVRLAASGATNITVTVRAPDRSATTTYTVSVTRLGE